MKKITAKLFKAICFILLFCLLLTACTENSGTQTTPSPSKPSPSKPSPSELSGIAVNIDDSNLTILTGEGILYTFCVQGKQAENITGCTVNVYYYGTLDKTTELQTVEVDHISVDSIINTANENMERAKQILSKMTLEEKVGQMFIVRCPVSNADKMVSKYHLGGYILFARDFQGKEKAKVQSEIKSYQDASKIGMLIGVDEEGGTVNRVSLYKQFRYTQFLSPQSLYAQGGWDLIISDTEEKAALLKSLGINLNLAPVCDVSTNSSDYIYKRAFGQNAALTSIYVNKVVNTMCQNQIGCVLKHFPGYGNNADTHTGIAYDDRSYETFIKSDFLPFISGINAGADVILVSHNIVESIDENAPASLSEKTHYILRNDLNFDGVIMTDDLSMDAITNYTGEKEAAVKAVLAGNDMICCTDFETQIPAIIKAVKDSDISEDTINEAVLRILCFKLSLGIVE